MTATKKTSQTPAPSPSPHLSILIHLSGDTWSAQMVGVSRIGTGFTPQSAVQDLCDAEGFDAAVIQHRDTLLAMQVRDQQILAQIENDRTLRKRQQAALRKNTAGLIPFRRARR